MDSLCVTAFIDTAISLDMWEACINIWYTLQYVS